MAKHVVTESDSGSTSSITIAAWLIFYGYMTVYALTVFMQFSVLQVLSVSLSFMAIFVCLAAPLISESFKTAKFRFDLKRLCQSLAVAIILVLFFHSAGPVFKDYVKTFPLMELESGSGWHHDTAFHVSLIQSIMNFGYPSIGLNGHPFMGYHVLSHYIDALILLLTRLDPFDSYGLFSHFKIFTFLSALLFFIDQPIRHRGLHQYFYSIILLFPLAIGSWHAIGSHGLWMSSLVLVLASHFLFQLIGANKESTTSELCKAAAIIVVVALGKVSTGAMLAVFITPMLYFKQIRNRGVYVFIVGLMVFFLCYNRIFTYGNGLKFVSEHFSIKNAYDFVVEDGKMWTRVLNGNIVATLLFAVIAVVFPDKTNWRILLSSTISLLALFLITKCLVGFSPSDIWYFHYGLMSIATLFTFLQIVKHSAAIFGADQPKTNQSEARKIVFVAKVLFVSFIALLGQLVEQPSINATHFGYYSLVNNLKSGNIRPFESLNQILAVDKQVSLYRLWTGKVSRPLEIFNRGSLGKLSDELNIVREQHNARKSDVVLYVPHEILAREHWAYGMLIYAVTGTPLVNGIAALRKDYGFTSYGPEGISVDLRDFDEKRVCNNFGIKLIVKLKNLTNLDQETVECSYLLAQSLKRT